MRRERYGECEVYRELTPAGVGLCAVLGLVLEVVILLASGIHIGEVAVVVFAFLWLLFGILVSGMLLVLAGCRDRMNREPQPGHFREITYMTELQTKRYREVL